MVIEFDPVKCRQNVVERGLPFDLVEQFDWPGVLLIEEERKDYGELRLLILGSVGDRRYVAVVTPRDKDLRVISLRRASRKESRIYDQEFGHGGRTGGGRQP